MEEHSGRLELPSREDMRYVSFFFFFFLLFFMEPLVRK